MKKKEADLDRQANLPSTAPPDNTVNERFSQNK